MYMYMYHGQGPGLRYRNVVYAKQTDAISTLVHTWAPPTAPHRSEAKHDHQPPTQPNRRGSTLVERSHVLNRTGAAPTSPTTCESGFADASAITELVPAPDALHSSSIIRHMPHTHACTRIALPLIISPCLRRSHPRAQAAQQAGAATRERPPSPPGASQGCSSQ